MRRKGKTVGDNETFVTLVLVERHSDVGEEHGKWPVSHLIL
jgi:hypothetical protein